MLNSLISAFLMYSRIPMPQIEWKEENRRYALAFFPLVGAVIGLLIILWKYVCDVLSVGNFLFAAVSVLIPIIVTGGIHIDGFCDVTDAVSSFADKKKRLEIMSDPHIGSFAAIYSCIYFILQTALFSEIKSFGTVIAVSCGYVVSRALSGLSAVSFNSAKSEGALQNFVKPSHKKITAAAEIFFLFASAAIIFFFGGATRSILCMITAVSVFLYYKRKSYGLFGGTTGDLCGWFLQLCEIWFLAAAVISEKITEMIK